MSEVYTHMAPLVRSSLKAAVKLSKASIALTMRQFFDHRRKLRNRVAELVLTHSIKSVMERTSCFRPTLWSEEEKAVVTSLAQQLSQMVQKFSTTSRLYANIPAASQAITDPLQQTQGPVASTSRHLSRGTFSLPYTRGFPQRPGSSRYFFKANNGTTANMQL